MASIFSRSNLIESVNSEEARRIRDAISGNGTKNPFSITRSLSLNGDPTDPRDIIANSILNDRGEGRLTSGIRALVLLNSIYTQQSSGSLIAGDVIYEEFGSSRSDASIARVVYTNLGVQGIVDSLNNLPARPLELDVFLNMCVRIGKLILVGAFRQNQFDSDIRIRTKIIAKLYQRLI